ncbi:hypothetical protein GQ457_12G017960 [Hibiscus cannabinus]
METKNGMNYTYMGMGRSFTDLSINDVSSAFSDYNNDRSGEILTPSSQSRRLFLASTSPDNSDELIRQLISDLASCSVDEQKHAALDLRLLAKNTSGNRIKIAKADTIKALISLISSADPYFQENDVTKILNLSLCDENKEVIASSGVIKPLNGRFHGKKDASTALYSLCTIKENKMKVVEAGIMKPLVELMSNFSSNMVDKSAFVLTLLVVEPEAKTALFEEGGIHVLVEIIEVGSQRQKEIVVPILLQICEDSVVYCTMVAREGAILPLDALSQLGTNRAKQKASNPPKKSRPQCSYCSLLGHTKDKCYKLHGYPPGYKSRGVVSHANVALHGDQSIKNVQEPLNKALTTQQCHQLIAMLTNQLQTAASASDIPSTSINFAMQGKIISYINSLGAFATRTSWIIDSGASKHVDPLISQEVVGQSFQEEDGHSSHEIGCESASLQVDPLISQGVDGQSFQAEAGHSSLEVGGFHEESSNANPASASPDVIPNEPVQSVSPALIPVQARKSSRITQRPSYLKEYFRNDAATSKEDGASCTYPIEDYIANTRLMPSYSTFVANISSTYEPSFFHRAVKIPEWRIALDEELKAMESLQTWSVVPLPAGKKAIACKWVYQIKRKSDGTIDRYKARLVAKGFTQIEDPSSTNTFSPVAKITSFKVLLALAAVHDWHLLQLNVNNAFLNGVLDEEVYMQLPQGYNSEISESNMICKLHKSIYGLKQASRQWFHAFSKVALDYGFVQSPSEHSLFVKGAGVDLIALLVYVDDIVLAGSNLGHLKAVQSFLQHLFKLKELGPLKYFLGFEIARNKYGISLSQRHYALQLLEDTGSLAKKPHDLPISAPHNLSLTDV